MEKQGNTAREAITETLESERLRAELEEARAKLAEYEGNVVIQAQFHGEPPRYRLNSRCYLEDDTLHEEGEIIEYLNCPNLEMVPLNEPAKRRMQEYLEAITEGQREAALANGRPFKGLVLDTASLIAISQQDARKTAQKVEVVQMPEERGIVPQMPNMETDGQKRRRGRPAKAAAVVSSKMEAKKAVPQMPGSVLNQKTA